MKEKLLSAQVEGVVRRRIDGDTLCCYLILSTNSIPESPKAHPGDSFMMMYFPDVKGLS
jgi:hypothetical protein